MFPLKSLDGTHWLMEPGRLRRAVEQVARCPTCPTARELVELRRLRLEESRQVSARAIRAQKGKVGIIPIHGPVEQRMSASLEKTGGTSLEEVGVAFDVLLADPQVASIVFHIDSPGGSSYGTEELADKIFAARG